MTQALHQLIPALEQYGPRPALVAYTSDERTELSGHVLANWLIKNVNFLRDELLLEPDALMLISLPPHWKRTVMVVSAWLVGARVQLLASGTDYSGDDPDVYVTDSPLNALADRANDVVALNAVSLALRFNGEIGPVDTDWVQAVRSHSDALTAPLAEVTGPHIPTDAADLGERIALENIDEDDAPRALAAWLRGATVITPRSSLTPERCAAEGLLSEKTEAAG